MKPIEMLSVRARPNFRRMLEPNYHGGDDAY